MQKMTAIIIIIKRIFTVAVQYVLLYGVTYQSVNQSGIFKVA